MKLWKLPHVPVPPPKKLLDRNIEDMLTFLSVFAPNLHHVLIGGQHADKCRQDAYEELQILLNRREIK
jgi:hypothetical protein